MLHTRLEILRIASTAARKSQRRFGLPHVVRSQSRDVACYVCTEVLIGKALKILSLVGYFHRAALVSFAIKLKIKFRQSSSFLKFCLKFGAKLVILNREEFT